MGSGTRSTGVGFLILAAFLLVLGATNGAYAVDCTDLCGTIVGPECQISAASIAACPSTPPNNKFGAFTVNETLRIMSDGIITVPKLAGGNTLTLNITGDFFMDAGGKIVGDAGASPNDSSAKAATIIINANGSYSTTGNIFLAGGAPGAKISSDQQAGSCNGGRGGNITLNAAGDITTADGSVISANGIKCPAGAILIEATRCREGRGEQCFDGYIGTQTVTGCTIDIDGKVLSQSGNTGTGAKQAPGGGPITINAGCNLIVSDTGIVSSRGKDPGADLVHLQGGCSVNVCGLVESTGTGHAVPNSPTNHCDSTYHPGKPTNSTACVEVWTSGDLVIDSVPLPIDTIDTIRDSEGCKGEINADTGGPGGSSGTSWIDLFAGKNITIEGNNVAPYAVHANGNAGTNDNGGVITVKSKAGAVGTFGLAIQANAFGNGGKGGNVDVEAGGDPLVSIGNGFVNFHAASIQAKGANAGGGSQAGGKISARSWNARVEGILAGELNADGGKGKTPFSLGLVTLQGCGRPINPADGVNYTGTVTPSPFVNPGDACGGTPEFPRDFQFPICACCLQEEIE